MKARIEITLLWKIMVFLIVALIIFIIFLLGKQKILEIFGKIKEIWGAF